MDDDRRTTGPEGVRISGAEEARRIVAQPPMWAEDEAEAAGSAGDADWMQAGDTTLSGVLGDIDDGGERVHQMSQDGWDEPHHDAHDHALQESLPETAQDDEDRFPDEMYDEPASRRPPAGIATSTPTTSPGPSPAPHRASAGDAVKVIAVEPLDEPDDGWANFAGGGPRWRREAKDWEDVDAADTSGLGDHGTRVGALDPDRADESDLYTFDEPRSRRGPRPSDDPPAAAAGGASPSGRGRPSGGAPGRPPRGTKPGARPAAKPAPAATLGVRVVTGITLAAALGLIFYVGKRPAAAALVAIALAFAALEMLTALRQRGFRPAIPAVLAGLVAIVAATYWRGEQGVVVATVLSGLTVMLWYLLGAERDRPVVNIAVSLMAFGYIGMAGATAALLLRPRDGIGLLFAAIACTVGYDVVGYFVGSSLGRTKLAPEISPNKTVEGLIGGMAGSVVVGALVFGNIAWAPWANYRQGLLLGLAVAVAAPVGDLVESMLKRDLGMKDMGNVLPGHGGVLDRIDAMLFAVPAVFLVARALRLA